MYGWFRCIGNVVYQPLITRPWAGSECSESLSKPLIILGQFIFHRAWISCHFCLKLLARSYCDTYGVWSVCGDPVIGVHRWSMCMDCPSQQVKATEQHGRAPPPSGSSDRQGGPGDRRRLHQMLQKSQSSRCLLQRRLTPCACLLVLSSSVPPPALCTSDTTHPLRSDLETWHILAWPYSSSPGRYRPRRSQSPSSRSTTPSPAQKSVVACTISPLSGWRSEGSSS